MWKTRCKYVKTFLISLQILVNMIRWFTRILICLSDGSLETEIIHIQSEVYIGEFKIMVKIWK